MHHQRGRLPGKRVGVKQEIKVAASDVTEIRKGLDDLYLVIGLLLAVNCKTLLSQANNFVTFALFWSLFSSLDNFLSDLSTSQSYFFLKTHFLQIILISLLLCYFDK